MPLCVPLRLAMRSLLTIAACCAAGCATSSGPPLRFFSESVPQTHPAKAPGDAVLALTAQGTVETSFGHEWITLQVSNVGPDPFRFEYVTDEYVAHTWDGQVATLSKDFFDYTQDIAPGAEGSITLLLPSDLAAADITQIVGVFPSGQTLILKSASPSVHEQEPGLPLEPLAPRYTGSSESSVSPTSGARIHANVPAVVALFQTLGHTLRVDLRWNDDRGVTRLAPNDEHAFTLLPGQHKLYFVLRMPPLSETRGVIDVTASPGWPIRVTLDASPHLWGSEVAVRMWQGETLVWNRHFPPGAARP